MELLLPVGNPGRNCITPCRQAALPITEALLDSWIKLIHELSPSTGSGENCSIAVAARAG